jgi:hypothetical protein
LVGEFGSSLEQKIKSEFPIEDWEVHSRLTGSGLDKAPGITVRRRSWPEGCQIGFEADKLESAFGYGLAWHNASPKIKLELQDALKKKLGNGRKPTDYWPWYADIPRFGVVEAKHWNNSDTIQAMYGERDRLVRYFIDKGIKEVASVVSPILG